MSLRVALRVTRPAAWMGGTNYLLNICRVLRAHAPEVEPVLFVPPHPSKELETRYRKSYGQAPIIMPDRTARRDNLAILGFNDSKEIRAFSDHGIDLVFEASGYYGPNPSLPVLSWLPDFQHRRLPHLFSHMQYLMRDIRFRRILSTRCHVLLSSESARRDMERFFGRQRGTAHVVPFAVQLEQHTSREDGERVRIERGLPERYLFLPGQFWTHKNHRTVVEALGLLGSRAPVVVATGSPHDPRAPTLFQDLQMRAAELGVSECFRVLGLVPYPDMLALMSRADRLMNPSLFEGWSTTVEEARALGTPMLLSDIEVHREQAPAGTIFFDPRSPEDCARAMMDAMDVTVERFENTTWSDGYQSEIIFAKSLATTFLIAANYRVPGISGVS